MLSMIVPRNVPSTQWLIACHKSKAACTIPLYGPGLAQAKPKNLLTTGRAVNFQPAQAHFIEMSTTHSAPVRSFQCINMKLLLIWVIIMLFSCCCHFLRVTVRSLLPVICYCFNASFSHLSSAFNYRGGPSRAGPGLNDSKPKWVRPNKFWRPAGRAEPKNQWAGPRLEYWACIGV